MKIVYLEWADSQRRGTSVWTSRPTDADPDRPAIIKTVGWLIHETRLGVTVAAHVSADGADMSGELTIPKAAIFKRRTIGVRKDVK